MKWKKIESYRACAGSRIFFACIFLIKILIDNDSTISYIHFVTPKDAFERIIDLDTEDMVCVKKIIDLNIEVFAKKIIVTLVFRINNSSIYIAMALINQDITVLFYIVILVFKIRCFETVVFFLVSCFTDVTTKKQYP